MTTSPAVKSDSNNCSTAPSKSDPLLMRFRPRMVMFGTERAAAWLADADGHRLAESLRSLGFTVAEVEAIYYMAVDGASRILVDRLHDLAEGFTRPLANWQPVLADEEVGHV